MYLVRSEFMIRAGGSGEFEAGQARMAQEAIKLPGFLGATLLHSYSYPTKYAVTARFENVEAAWAFYKSDAFINYVNNRPPITLTRNEGYEAAFDVTIEGAQAAASTCEVLADWEVRRGATDAFERSRREFFEMRKTTKGFISSRLRRSAGTTGKYLVIHIYADVEAARAAEAHPELRAWLREHPLSLYADAPNQIESYFVVHRIGR